MDRRTDRQKDREREREKERERESETQCLDRQAPHSECPDNFLGFLFRKFLEFLRK